MVRAAVGCVIRVGCQILVDVCIACSSEYEWPGSTRFAVATNRDCHIVKSSKALAAYNACRQLQTAALCL